jgi:hypothetical protein
MGGIQEPALRRVARLILVPTTLEVEQVDRLAREVVPRLRL